MRHAPKTLIDFMGMLKTVGGESNARKIKAIEDIGFGSILRFDFQRFNSAWAAELVNAYNPHTSNIVLPNGDRVLVSENDVYCVFGFPKGDKEMKLYGNEEEDGKYNELLTKLRDLWGVTGECTSLPVMMDILENNDVDGEGLWIRSFLVAVVNCFIQSTSSSNLFFRFLYSVLEVSDVKAVNWGKMTCDSLIAAVKRWKGNKRSRFIGPLHFLMVCFFINKITCLLQCIALEHESNMV